MIEQRADERGARREVQVDRAARHAGALGGGGHGQRLEAVGLEQRPGGVEQRRAGAPAAGVARGGEWRHADKLHMACSSVYARCMAESVFTERELAYLTAPGARRLARLAT